MILLIKILYIVNGKCENHKMRVNIYNKTSVKVLMLVASFSRFISLFEINIFNCYVDGLGVVSCLGIAEKC